jgi:predicted metalloprotease with PDZ domain
MPKVGPAQRAGLVVGDFVIEIDGSAEPITEDRWLEYLYKEKTRGQTVKLTVIHKGRREEAQLVVS